MRFAVIGTGAIGGLFGGLLAKAGHDVTFLARPASAEKLRAEGLTVTSPTHPVKLTSVAVATNPDQIGPVDAVVLTVKTWQVPDLLPSLRPLLRDGTAIIPLQNGVETPKLIQDVIGGGHGISATCWVVAARKTPSLIEHLDVPPRMALGEFDNSHTPRIESLRQAFNDSGINTFIPDNIDRVLWEKFVFVAAVGGIGAVTRSNFGEMRSRPDTSKMLMDSFREFACVGRALGVPIKEDCEKKAKDIFNSTADSATSSMQRDIMSGLPSELEAQTGAIVRLGRESGVPTPVSDFTYASLILQEHRARRQAGLQ